jgi:hypothetical protein
VRDKDRRGLKEFNGDIQSMFMKVFGTLSPKAYESLKKVQH